MAKIAPLCSSSKGNAVVVSIHGENFLIDAGCSYRQLNAYLGQIGLSIEQIHAVLITHEHVDHIKGLRMISAHTAIPIYMSEGTLRAVIEKEAICTTKHVRLAGELAVAPPFETQITPFHTPHDSAESLGFTFEIPDTKIAYCTDLGMVTETVRQHMLSADVVFLEANYDQEMLANNHKYPAYVKNRISSNFGHLCNTNTAEFAAQLIRYGATRFMLGHLSEENNCPTLAFQTVLTALEKQGMTLNADYTLDVAAVQSVGKYMAI